MGLWKAGQCHKRTNINNQIVNFITYNLDRNKERGLLLCAFCLNMKEHLYDGTFESNFSIRAIRKFLLTLLLEHTHTLCRCQIKALTLLGRHLLLVGRCHCVCRGRHVPRGGRQVCGLRCKDIAATTHELKWVVSCQSCAHQCFTLAAATVLAALQDQHAHLTESACHASLIVQLFPPFHTHRIGSLSWQGLTLAWCARTLAGHNWVRCLIFYNESSFSSYKRPLWESAGWTQLGVCLLSIFALIRPCFPVNVQSTPKGIPAGHDEVSTLPSVWH